MSSELLAIPDKWSNKIIRANCYKLNASSHYGLAIFIPGFLDSKDYANATSLCGELASLGYVALAFDPVGTWQSAGDMGDYKVSNIINNLKTLIEYGHKNYKLSTQRALLLGHSLGGLIALHFASKHNEMVSVVISTMPSYAFVTPETQEMVDSWKKNGVKKSIRDGPFNQTSTVTYTVPYAFVEDALKYNVLSVIPKLTRPLLLLAGGEDAMVSAESVQKIFNAARTSKEFYSLPGIIHDYRKKKRMLQPVNYKILEFIKKYAR